MKHSVLAAAIAATFIAMPAFAAVEDFQFEVTFAPEKLETSEGARDEYTNIAKQVAERCAAEHVHTGLGRIHEVFATRICTAQTLNRAVRQIDHPQLTEVHAASRAAG